MHQGDMAANEVTINTAFSSNMNTDTTAHHSPTSLHDSARGSPEPPLDSFHTLVQSINEILGPCNGIDSAGVDVEEQKSAMRAFDGPDEEWQKYAFQDYSRPYTRNLVDRGNGKSNLVSLLT